MLEGLFNMLDRVTHIQKRMNKMSKMTSGISFRNRMKSVKIDKSVLVKDNNLSTNKIISQKNDKLISKLNAKPLKNIRNGYDNSSYDKLIKKAAGKYDLPFPLIKAVIKQESNFNPKALSKVGAQGLMQLMPSTAKILNVDDPYNAEKSILGGSRYLKDMLDRYQGNLSKALAAYNAGPNIVDKTNGVPNYNETKNYIKNVLGYYSKYSK